MKHWIYNSIKWYAIKIYFKEKKIRQIYEPFQKITWIKWVSYFLCLMSCFSELEFDLNISWIRLTGLRTRTMKYVLIDANRIASSLEAPSPSITSNSPFRKLSVFSEIWTLLSNKKSHSKYWSEKRKWRSKDFI